MGSEAFLFELDGLFSLHSQYQEYLNTDDPTKQGPMVSVAMAALFYFSWNIPSSAELKPLKRFEVYAVHVLESLRVAPNMFQGAECTYMYPQGQYACLSPDYYVSSRKLFSRTLASLFIVCACSKPRETFTRYYDTPDSKIHGANMGTIWGRQDPGGPHVCPMNFAIWVYLFM